VDAAKGADCAFLVLGLDQFIENEGKDIEGNSHVGYQQINQPLVFLVVNMS